MYYCCYEDLVREATSNPMDSTVLARLGDEIDEYLTLVTEVRFSVPATINETEYYLACPHLCSQLGRAELNTFQHRHHADRYQMSIPRDT